MCEPYPSKNVTGEEFPAIKAVLRPWNFSWGEKSNYKAHFQRFRTNSVFVMANNNEVKS